MTDDAPSPPGQGGWRMPAGGRRGDGGSGGHANEWTQMDWDWGRCGVDGDDMTMVMYNNNYPCNNINVVLCKIVYYCL